MFEHARATIRHRKGPFVGMFVAVLAAAALVTALGVLFESGLRSGVPPQRFAGVPVVVGAQQALPVEEDIDLPFSERVPLPVDVVAKVGAVAGVERAIGDTAVAVTIGGRPVAGHGWGTAALTPFSLRDGEAPRENGVVLDSALAGSLGVSTGDSVDIAIGAVPRKFTVTGVTAEALGRESTLFFTDEQAGELYGRPKQVDAVGVLAKPGVDPEALAERISAAVPESVVYTGDARGDVEFLDVGQVRSQLIVLSLAFAGSAIMIAMLVVASTLALSVRQRRREIALLRAVAATSRQVHRMIGAEILVVAGSAAVLGALPGYGVAFGLRAAFSSAGMLPADFGLAISPLPAVAAILLCLGTARAAGWVAARRVARIQPVEALRESDVDAAPLGRVRVLIGRLALVAGTGASALPVFLPGDAAMAGAAGSAMLMVVGIALLGPRLVEVAIRLVGGPLRAASPVGGYLAVANVSASARRLAVAVTPLVLAVTMASVQLFTQTTIAAEAEDQAGKGVVADFVVSAPSGLAPSVTSAVAEADGVSSVTPVVRSQVFVKYLMAGSWTAAAYAAQGVSPDGLSDTLDLQPREGTMTGLRGDTVALSTMAAETIGVDVGETIELHLGDGTVMRPRVVATYGRGLGFGDLTLPHDVLASHTTTRLDQSILVAASDPAVARRALSAIAGVSVVDRQGLTAAGQAQRDTERWVNLIGLFLILGYVAIAVVNTLVMATAARSREFALLRLVGTGSRQVRRMTRIEACIVVAIALVVGSLASLPPLVGIAIGMTGSPFPTIAPLAYLVVVVVTAVLGLLAISVPTRLALRTRPVDALG
ncbi:ABC transporter permease [Actinophytocola oryzae]|uniref:Putative ABC transport system permease protein n=1 Tax=Actinophytocola oryzae TaxID=502181 RepID=A0A4R7VV43_9PSEU|nr:FtsX-like permease family protein [Actinophytocola oryzae]TDV53870.1 putative ABC transport system permease protein [Actinophytocola oryzae]